MLEFQGKVMLWDFGRASRMGKWSLAKGWLLRWKTVEEYNFGRIVVVERIP